MPAESHDPLEFEAMGEACEVILSSASSGAAITVPGDYEGQSAGGLSRAAPLPMVRT